MNAFGELGAAVRGWWNLLSSKPQGADHFNPTNSGLINALGFYVAIVLLAIGVDGYINQLSTTTAIANGMLANLLPLIAVAIVIFATITVLRLDVAYLDLLVPAIYALGFILLIGIPFALLTAGAYSAVLLGALGYMLFRLGREIGRMNVGISMAFAALSIVALVALPLALYMLTTPVPPPAA